MTFSIIRTAMRVRLAGAIALFAMVSATLPVANADPSGEVLSTSAASDLVGNNALAEPVPQDSKLSPYDDALAEFSGQLGPVADAAEIAEQDLLAESPEEIQIEGVRPLAVGESGIVIALPGVDSEHRADAIAGGAFAEDTANSTDTIVLQSSGGFVESFSVLKDENAPARFTSQVTLPMGHSLMQGPDNTAAVVDGAGDPVVIVSAPYAVDANDVAVPLVLTINGSEIVISVASDGPEQFEFPILVDPSYYFIDGINGAEGSWCKWPWRWSICSDAQGHANAALSTAQSLYPKSLHNGRGDAFRHCYWSARMRSDFGYDDAKGFGDRHEDFAGNPALEKTMDLRNNALGLSVALKGSTSYSGNKASCKAKADANGLWRIVNGTLV